MKYAGWIIAAAVVLLALTQGRQTQGPTQPTVVAGAIAGGDVDLHRVYRFWSDGTVDESQLDYPSGNRIDCEPVAQCGPLIIIPGSCTGDITRDGAVATADLLEVLETWGPCN